jgi:hypothetical protein
MQFVGAGMAHGIEFDCDGQGKSTCTSQPFLDEYDVISNAMTEGDV